MSAPPGLVRFLTEARSRRGIRWRGEVREVRGALVESQGPPATVGERCQFVNAQGEILEGEIVGFRGARTLAMALAGATGLGHGDSVFTWGARPGLRVDSSLLGRVIDGEGRALDGRGTPGGVWQSLEKSAPAPLDRARIDTPLASGIRSVDAFLTCGRGQRLGIFGGSGVGKSTLLGMMARGTDADLTVMALVGERGREVRGFLEDVLGEEGRRRAIVVVSTSDQSPLQRIRAALAAVAIAEFFSAQGKHVLLVLDSLTRLAMAQREIGLAAGEPPTSKGYTPSVFALLARLLERAGNFGSGSITGFYTVLMEGDDLHDPIVDGARALLDGHIVLDRRLAMANHYPPVSLLDSLSRLMPALVTPEHLRKAGQLRALLASYRAAEDLVRLGAYHAGSDTVLDRALEVVPEIERFMAQIPVEQAPWAENVRRLLALPE
jgi:flagellum-specific ATP synthase